MPMPTVKQFSARHKSLADAPARPRWLDDLLCGCESHTLAGSVAGLDLAVFDAAGHRLVRARLREAAALNDAEFQAATIAAYGDLLRQLYAPPMRHAVRIWNYLPDIHRVCGDGLDRYMVFNAGRFKACQKWLGSDEFQQHLPTASGVGHQGRDLVIDALGMDVKGVAVENPRQTPAYHYSRHYGPLPPCFARAMTIAAADRQSYRLLVGGTASVRGEVSVHETDLAAQIDETLDNLASLVRAAAARYAGAETTGELNDFRELRVYYPRRADGPTIFRLVRPRFPAGTRIECIPAKLCRKELLVEIEGVAVGSLKAHQS
jgi:chorismate lyase / 3-hydroxybenzoate synthase